MFTIYRDNVTWDPDQLAAAKKKVEENSATFIDQDRQGEQCSYLLSFLLCLCCEAMTSSFAYIHIDFSRNVSMKTMEFQNFMTSLFSIRFTSKFHCFVRNFLLFLIDLTQTWTEFLLLRVMHICHLFLSFVCVCCVCICLWVYSRMFTSQQKTPTTLLSPSRDHANSYQATVF